jgi:ribosomal-protein-alanine N-acetyltransferase
MNETAGEIGKLTIRSLKPSDLRAVVKLEREIFPDPWPRSAFEDILREEGWYALVAETDTGEMAGYACYLILGPEGHLANIAVAPAFRRKSVAKRLLDNILSAVEENECEYLLLEVRPSNSSALAFYEKQGFAFLYRRPNYYSRPVEDAIVLVRYLTAYDSAE